MNEPIKIKIAIKNSTDIENLRKLALYLCNTLLLITNKKEIDNYSVYSESNKHHWYSGTKDRCIGYAEAIEDKYNLVVVCGDMIVWPDDRWGDNI